MSELTVTFDGFCGCGQPAMYKDERGTWCLGCLYTPEARPGIVADTPNPEDYSWQGPADSQSMWCRYRWEGYYCVVAKGHSGLHENWISGIRNGDANPRFAWDSAGKIAYDRGSWVSGRIPPSSTPGPGYVWQGKWRNSSESGSWCGTYNGKTGGTCNLTPGHSGLHEAWTTLEHGKRGHPCVAWTADGTVVFREGSWENLPKTATTRTATNPSAPAWRSGWRYATQDNRCDQCCEGYACTRKKGHVSGWHEAWQTSSSYHDPVIAWSANGTEIWRRANKR